MTIYVTFFVDRGSGNEKGLLEGKKSNELSLKTDSGNDMGKRSFWCYVYFYDKNIII